MSAVLWNIYLDLEIVDVVAAPGWYEARAAAVERLGVGADRIHVAQRTGPRCAIVREPDGNFRVQDRPGGPYAFVGVDELDPAEVLELVAALPRTEDGSARAAAAAMARARRHAKLQTDSPTIERAMLLLERAGAATGQGALTYCFTPEYRRAVDGLAREVAGRVAVLARAGHVVTDRAIADATYDLVAYASQLVNDRAAEIIAADGAAEAE